MRVLVTGGAGFIGSHITERLVTEGNEVTVLDILTTGNEQNLTQFRSKIDFLPANAGAIPNKKFDLIIHQGAHSSSPMYKENPMRFAEVVEQFLKLLEYARKNETKIVFASSSSVYNGVKPPQREDAQLRISDYYTEGRIVMERMAELYHNLYGTSVTALRYFSVYGPREEYKKTYANLITQFLWAMRKDEDVVIYGDGNQTRDFTYVSDVVEANFLAAKAKGFGIYNVGTGKNLTINQMIALLEEKLGKKAKLRYVENKIKNYVQETLADTVKAKDELGFEAKVTLREGIEKIVAYYK
jgi:UDP-glucose 4-epimerase